MAKGLGMVRVLAVCVLACVLAWPMSGCRKTYAQDTPEAVLASAKQMVKDGNARALTGLVYADSPQMRRLLEDTGEVLASLQRLADNVRKQYPEEIEKLRADAEEAAKKGEATSFVQRLGSSMGSQPRRRGARGGGGDTDRGGPPNDQQQEQFNRLFRDLFANPYAFLEDQQGRLSVKQVTDDTAAVLWDSKPLLGVGLTMKRESDRWYVVLPTSVPPMSRLMPKSEEGWQVLGEVMGMVTNLFDDLNDDVVSGKAKRLDDLARLAGDKAFLPAAMIAIAYGKTMEEDRKAEKAAAPAGPAPSSDKGG